MELSGALSSEMVKEFGLDAGADMVGIASSKDFGSAPDGSKPSDILAECLSVIVLGSPFPQGSILGSSADYTKVRNETYRRMDDIAKAVAKRIKGEGYKATTITGLGSKISLKHAAELAGLGIIGRNYLLINSEHGNLLWFSAVLTDADLTPDEKAQYTVCENCRKCVEMCPSKALDDLDSFRKKECSGTCFKMVDGKWEIKCYLCRKVCPYRFGIY